MLNLFKVGISEDDSAINRLRVLLINLIVIFSLPIFMLYLPSFIQHEHYLPLILYILSVINFLIALWLNHKKNPRWAAILILSTSSLIVAYSLAIYGKTTELQVIFPLITIFVFVFFDKLFDRIIIGGLNVLSFLSCYLYIDLFQPIFLPNLLFLGNYINLSFGILASGIFSYAVMHSLKQHSEDKELSFNELARQKAVIENQNEEMELFTTMASHDLKTPIRTVNSFLGLIEKTGELKSSKAIEYLNLAQTGALQLNQLVSGISTFRKQDNQTFNDNYEKTEDILEKVKHNVNPSNDDRIIIKNDKLPDLKILPEQIYLVFQNLIENALKYNESELKELSITHTIEDNRLHLYVDDNGIGMEEEYLEYIFEPFKKLHSTSKYEGTGLGLSICQKIVKIYDGTISAKVIPNGSRIEINLPSYIINSSLSTTTQP